MNIVDKIASSKKTAFSYEILPPIKGAGISPLLETVERLQRFDPSYINITTHRSEYVFVSQDDGNYRREKVQRRPGTVAVAAALQQHFNVPTVPHILCSGYTAQDIEYILIDLQFLEIENLLVLRGDKAPGSKAFEPEKGGFIHTTELLKLINNFNNGCFFDGKVMSQKNLNPFHCGVACYPEKHDEAPNVDRDIYWLKQKIALGAEYAVTQLFYDNNSYFQFMKKVRAAGITIPIIPGIKPITRKKQVLTIPKVFGIDIPQSLFQAINDCSDDDEARKVGIRWCIEQCQGLMEAGVPSIHFYTMGRAYDIEEIAQTIY